MTSLRILVRGSGDIGSAVAYFLFRAGHRVLIHDLPCPPHTRRGMAFADALFERTCMLEGMLGKRARDAEDIPPMLSCRRALPLADISVELSIQALEPDVIVDARMQKHELPEQQRGSAPVTIGLGPGFVAGEQVDLVVETAWGDELGRLIHRGSSKPLGSSPRPLGGLGRERFGSAPVEGVFRTAAAIGTKVRKGQIIATIESEEVVCPATGVLRGLCHDGARVKAGAKVVEVDPRLEDASVFGLGKRPSTIALGVLSALDGLNAQPPL